MASKSGVWAAVVWVLALGAAGGISPALQVPVATKAVIRYSTAPWDDVAYELIVPLKPQGKASHPVLRVDLWGNPEFAKRTTLHFSRTGDPMVVGRAYYQPIHNESLPEALSGTITFESLKQRATVSGKYDLSGSKGRVFRGRFVAKWGNTKSWRRGG